MPRKRKYTDEQFITAVKESESISKVLQKLVLKATGGNYKLAKNRIKKLNIDISHMTGRGHLKGKTHNWSKKKSLEEILIKDSDYANSNNLRKRLIKEGIFEKKCYNCGLTDWLGARLAFELEHKNGANNDNRIENLTILCPNCHSQTPTYCGRNIHNSKQLESNNRLKPKLKIIKPKLILKNNCKICNVKIIKGAVKCKNCFNDFREPKIIWPSKEELELMLTESNFSAVGKKLGVSDNAVRKHLKKLK